MPAFTYFHDHEAERMATVEGDKDCNDLLRDLCRVTEQRWIIDVRQIIERRFLRKPTIWKHYSLYCDVHRDGSEWQAINLVTPKGGSVFHGSRQSREDVMNFMMGVCDGAHSAKRFQKAERT